MRRRTAPDPADADATLERMSLLSPPTEEMKTAASALIHDPRTAPHVSDQKLRLAIEQVISGFDDHDRRLCADMDAEPRDSEARLAFELALAQRISSTALALSVEEPPGAAG
jgi:hypothetical protein